MGCFMKNLATYFFIFLGALLVPTAKGYSMGDAAKTEIVTKGTIHFKGKTYYRLDGQTLENTLIGKHIPGQPLTEVFLENGKYVVLGGRAAKVIGHYKIVNSTFCTKIKASEYRCRALFRNNDEEYAAANIASSEAQIIPYEIVIRMNDGQEEL